ncbi:carboxymuconolactone decarboxylase family protein [Pseudomonas serbica]|uniref:carboxymuconolactone decarboxylase family protein n=1 Tax=Pseudomonas serbica TaxID=2965074 RepID=UPI0039E56101
MIDNDNWKAGYDLMVRMMGPEFAKTMEANVTSGRFAADVGRMAVEHAFGAVWSRPGLDLKVRSVVVISSLIALRQTEELRNHLRFGLNNGLTPDELQEVIIQTVPYVGFPAVSSALAVAVEVLRERGLDGGVKTASETGLL